MFQYNCEVFYEDTDMGGRVYHANYLKFIERARSKFIEYLNVDQRATKFGKGPKLLKFEFDRLPDYIKKNKKKFERWLD